MEILQKIYEMTAFSAILKDPLSILMIGLALFLLYLGIGKKFEPLLLVPIAFGVLLANFPGGNMGVVPATMENGISEMTILEIAEKHGIPYKTDVYPFYGSDGEAFWRAGGDVQLSLIGPGIDASHNYERAHIDGLNASTNWIMAYLLEH